MQGKSCLSTARRLERSCKVLFDGMLESGNAKPLKVFCLYIPTTYQRTRKHVRRQSTQVASVAKPEGQD